MKSLTTRICLAVLCVLFFTCKQQQPDWSNVVTFVNPAPQSVVADGYDTLRLVAQIGKDSDPDKRVITFTTDNGIFTNGQNTITVNADTAGRAAATIKGTVVAKATVKATVQTTFTASTIVNFTAPQPSQIFSVTQISGTTPADGMSTAAINVMVNPALLITPQSVAFTSDGGTFGNGTATVTLAADPTGDAAAYLKSAVPGTFHVSVTNDGLSQYVPVTFVNAAPDYLLLSAQDTLTHGYSKFMTVTISAKRNIGTPTVGYLFSYTATDSSGNNVGIFTSGTASDATGAATVNFSMGASTYLGPVTITVTLQQNPATKATALVQIL